MYNLMLSLTILCWDVSFRLPLGWSTEVLSLLRRSDTFVDSIMGIRCSYVRIVPILEIKWKTYELTKHRNFTCFFIPQCQFCLPKSDPLGTAYHSLHIQKVKVLTHLTYEKRLRCKLPCNCQDALLIVRSEEDSYSSTI